MKKTGAVLVVAVAATACTGGPSVSQQTEAVTTCADLSAAADTTVSSINHDPNLGAAVVLHASVTNEALLRFDVSSLPTGAVVQSAAMNLFPLGTANAAPIQVHRATAMWDEATATFATFAQHFDPQVIGSIDGLRDRTQKSIDVTPLAQGWISGAVANDGVVLVGGSAAEVLFASRENHATAERPVLTVCYTTPVDHCASQPCENGGTCQNNETGYTCQCPAGYTGASCETLIDNCAANPCLNGATCTNQVGSYTCQCAAGFTGTNCDVNIDDCTPDPCLNGGVCTDGIASYTCQCPLGYTGASCETLVDNCASNPCLNGASCTNQVASYTCQCATGFTGTNCEINIDDCGAGPCLNGGTCIDGVNAYTCSCPPTWGGTNCDVNLDVCAQLPCLNGGTCTDGFGTYTCQCPAGFTGTNCEIDVNECSPNPCQNGGTCIDLQNAYACQCPISYAGANCETDESSAAGVAIAVPLSPFIPTAPHPILSGAMTTVRAIVVENADQFQWDFGDGSSTLRSSIANSFDVSAQHTYMGSPGQIFIATLHVWRAGVPGVSAVYIMKVVDPTSTADRATMAAEAGLWKLHVAMTRSIYPAGAPTYGQAYGDLGGPLADCATIAALARRGTSVLASIYADPYADDLRRLSSFVYANLLANGVSPQQDANGNGVGLYIGDPMTDGACQEAFALAIPPAYPAPLGSSFVYGRTAREIAQDLADYSASIFQQYNGSWYGAPFETYWGLLGLMSDQKLGATTAASIETSIASFFAAHSDAVVGGACGSWWDGYQDPLLDTAGGLLATQLTSGVTSATYDAALGYLYQIWPRPTAASCSFTTYVTQAALLSGGVQQLANYACDGSGGSLAFDWYAGPTSHDGAPSLVSQLVSAQDATGGWTDSTSSTACWYAMSPTVATALDISALERPAVLGPSAAICDCQYQTYDLNQPIALNGNCSVPGAAPIARYEWDVDYAGTFVPADPATVPQTNGTVTFAAGFPSYATHQIALRVTDTNGVQSVGTCAVVVKPPPHCPHPDLGGGPLHVYQTQVNVPVTFDASASFDPDNDPLTYSWSLWTPGVFGDSTALQATYTYAVPGTYSIALQVTDQPYLNQTPYNAAPCTASQFGIVVVH